MRRMIAWLVVLGVAASAVGCSLFSPKISRAPGDHPVLAASAVGCAPEKPEAAKPTTVTEAPAEEK